MDKKKILIIVGVVAVIGIGYYMYNKSKKTAEGGAEGGAEAPADATATKSAEAPADATATAKTPLTSRKEKKQACGRKPLNKKKKAEWQKCVDAGGTASFEGDFDEFEKDYIDFEGEVDNQFMYSDFDNSLNLDL
jgi:hypothetical protein